MNVNEITERLTKPRRTRFSLKVQAVVFVLGAALAPLVVLLAVSSKFFQYGPRAAIPFEYWAFLTVAWVVASALVMAHILAQGITDQLEPIAQSVDVLRRTAQLSEAPKPASDSGNELENLATQFSRLEAALADSRAAALGKIARLEAENARLSAAHDSNAAFLSAVSHEIRTPLSAIVSAARIIQHYHEKKPEVVARFGETIATEGKRLVRLVSDLLDLTKMEAKTLDWSQEMVRPADLAAVAIRRLESQIAEHSVTILTDVSESLPRLRGDEKRLVQVLECLIENAIKYSPARSTVRVAAAEHDGVLRFSVSDSGAKIPHAVIASMFDKSYTTTPRDTEECARHSASLLGLPLCYEVVRHHGGSVWVNDASESGATFCFEIPLPAPGADEAESEVSSARPRAARVMLVMANDVLADAAQRALRLDEADVRLCTHFQEVLSMLPTWIPEVLVVSSNCLWQLTEGIEAKLRRNGVGHIMMFSPYEGMVDLSAPTHSEPVLTRLASLTPRGANVLLVEDDEEYATVLEFELTQAGYRVTRTRDGVEALAAIEARPPDAMILDLVLPRLDGFGVLEALAAKQSPVRTVVVTALDDARLEERLVALGVAGMFRKYEMIQPRTTECAARVRKILTPVLGVAPASAAGRLAYRARA
jgi:signal transduction histidine kinase/CheY-like chemotaxis protein